MKRLLELGNRFAANSDWTDFALTKFCLCAMGIIIGALIPATSRTAVMIIAGIVFVVTYVILMKKVFRIIREMKSDR